MKLFQPKYTHLILAKTLEFQAHYPGKERIEKDEIREFEFKYELTDALLYEEKVYRIELGIEIGVLLPKKKKARKAGFIRTEFFFLVEDLRDWVTKEGESIVIKRPLTANLAALAFSTTRGLLMAKTAGTFLESCVLPIIDAYSLLEYREEFDWT